jgi:hypothetical protein
VNAMDKINLITGLKEKGMSDVGEYMLSLMQQIDADVASLKAKQDELENTVESLTSSMDRHKEAFPNGDVHGHRIYHEKVIRTAMANEGIKHSLKGDVLQKALFLILGLAATGLGLKWVL